MTRAEPGHGGAAVAPTRSLRRDRDFVLFWTANSVSYAGTAITMVALPVLMYSLTGAPFMTALAVATGSGAYLLFGLFAGAVADRHDRRRVLIVTDVVNALLLSSVPVAAWLGLLTVWQVLVVAAASAVANVFSNAAGLGALPGLVGRAKLPTATSAISGTVTVIGLVVPALTGAVLAVVPAAHLIAVDAISFGASALLLSGIGRRLSGTAGGDAARRLLAEIGEGLRYIVGHPTIRAMTLVGVAQSAFVGATFAQFVPFADQRLGIPSGDARLGGLYVTWSLGALVASLMLPRLMRAVPGARITLLVTPVSAVLGLLIGLSSAWVLAFALVGVWSVVVSLNASVTVIVRQQEAPERLVGRVSASGRMLAWGIGNPAGALLGGWAAQAVDPGAAFVVGAGFGMAAALAAWGSSLRRPAMVTGETT